MRFVFTRLFYALLALGLVPLSLSWGRPGLRWLTLAFDAGLLAAAFLDSRASRLPEGFEIVREFGGRFHIGAETEVLVRVSNHTPRAFKLKIKDEYPPEMTLLSPREAELSLGPQESQTLVYVLRPPRRGRFEFGRVAVRYVSRLGLVWREERAGEASAVKVYPKLDTAIHAALALMGAARRAGDHAGLIVFGRRVRAFVPPSKGREQVDAVLEALHAVEPELIEPSYTRAFEFIAANCKRRSFVVLLTDLVDRSEEHTSELQSRQYLVCRLLLEKKKKITQSYKIQINDIKYQF